MSETVENSPKKSSKGLIIGIIIAIIVIAGGVIPPQDYDFLYNAGVAAIFGPGTPVAKSAYEVTKILMQMRGWE